MPQRVHDLKTLEPGMLIRISNERFNWKEYFFLIEKKDYEELGRSPSNNSSKPKEQCLWEAFFVFGFQQDDQKRYCTELGLMNLEIFWFDIVDIIAP